ncbi:hypothetical protein [Cobetia sp. 29-18-1]|uniref:hypothetical protein n=1 Tax=Cobetia sp. 29-18-1 TaxID=3040018 RepID=UPI0024478AF7|nr:hypothetical protein [Cobetia sp. 29-18-1]MDH2299655.1 hypothetical protein [Cobetia sp. 29-18-1]
MDYILMRRGTLLILSGPVKHLHIVMNDPVVNPITGHLSVLLVNISSIPESGLYDSTCILTPENCSHAFVKRPSYVYYREAVIKSVEGISQKVSLGEFSPHEDFPEDAFRLVLTGFHESEFVTRKILKFIERF